MKNLESGIHTVELKGWIYDFYNNGQKFILTNHSNTMTNRGYTVTGRPMRFENIDDLLSYLSSLFSLTIEKLLDIIK